MSSRPAPEPPPAWCGEGSAAGSRCGAVAIGTSLAAAAFGGARIVHTDGVDFRLLDPLWLTVGLFVLIPGLWGATVVIATERLLRCPIEGLPPRVHRRYWGATGWILLVGITAVGTRGLVADVATLRCSTAPPQKLFCRIAGDA